MPPAKPQNHVTRALEAARLSGPRDTAARCPEVPQDLLEYLEATYPPRVYDHRTETLEDHIDYAGQVRLVQTLRHRFEEQREIEADPDEEE